MTEGRAALKETGSHPAAGGFKRLPKATARFGRDEECKTLVELFSGELPAIACVLGPGGIGKSNLCWSVLDADDVKKKFGRRRAFVRCDAATGRESLVKFIAEEIRVEIGPNLEDRVLDELERAPAMVVLDNFESPWELETEPVEIFLSLLANLDGVGVIVGLRGQEKPRGVSFNKVISVKDLSPDDAAKLFLTVTEQKFASDPALQPLLKEMDYLPLAVELLAYHAQGESSLALLKAAWEEKRTQILGRGKADDCERSIAASIELSFNSPRMTADSKKLACLLGVLPNGITNEDLSAILGKEGITAAMNLHRVGLAFAEDGRTLLLAPIRSYLAEFHKPDDMVLKPAMVHFVEIGTTLGGRVGKPGGDEAVQKVSADYENIVAMIKTVLNPQNENWKLGIDAACGLAEFIRFTGFGDSTVLKIAEKMARVHGYSVELANCIYRLGAIAFDRSDHTEAHAKYEEAKHFYQDVGDVIGQADCIRSLGDIALDRSDHKEARKRYEEAMPLYELENNLLGKANCIKGLGDIALYCSDYAEAQARFEEAMPLYEIDGSALGQVNCIKGLGDIALRRSDTSKALARYKEAEPLYVKVGSVLGQANCIKCLGDIALMSSDYKEARAQYEKAQPLYKHVGDMFGQANCIQGFGNVFLAEFNLADAKAHFELAIPMYEKVSDVEGQADCFRGLGDIAKNQKDLRRAMEWYLKSLELFEGFPQIQSIGELHHKLALITEGDERAAHIAAAREAWTTIDRPDLVALLDEL